MMASNLPPSNLPAVNTHTSGVESQPPVATPVVRAFFINISDTIRHRFADRRPWSELIDRSAFSKPDSIADATSRIRKNYAYFRINYLSLITLVMIFSLLTHPVSLILLLGILAAWIFLYLFRPSDPPLVILGRTFSERETLGMLVINTIVVIFLTNVGYVLTSAVLIGLAIVCGHGAFRVPEDLFLDEPESAATGFLSLITGGGAAVASPSPVVVTTTGRV